jgi:hypothetical protein
LARFFFFCNAATSEEIFDFSSGQMTQAKIAELKNQFNKEFSLIYKLCEAILENSQVCSPLSFASSALVPPSPRL